MTAFLSPERSKVLVSRLTGRNIKGRPFGGDFDRGSLRSDCRQGSRPAARRSARASLRVLDCILAAASVLPGGSGRSPFLGCARLDEFSLVREVMPPQKNRSASPVARNLWARIKGRPFRSRVWVLVSIPTERNALNE